MQRHIHTAPEGFKDGSYWTSAAIIRIRVDSTYRARSVLKILMFMEGSKSI